jgi:hypothetical protein
MFLAMRALVPKKISWTHAIDGRKRKVLHAMRHDEMLVVEFIALDLIGVAWGTNW